MFYIKHKTIFEDCPDNTSLSASNKLHQCSFSWSDKCAHCEMGFDKLKQKLISIETTHEHLEELSRKIEECLEKLKGL